MSFYRCFRCGAEFEEPVFVEDGTFLGNTVGYYICPECGDDEVEEGCECLKCGQWAEYNYCDGCMAELKKRFSAILHENFSDEEIEALNEIYDGEEIN